jgi:hypothetical protein
VHRANTTSRKTRREAFVEALLSRLPVVAFDLLAARTHARLWAKLAARGVSVGALDLIIGATAISRGMDVVTRDDRSFRRIHGLSVIRWQRRITSSSWDVGEKEVVPSVRAGVDFQPTMDVQSPPAVEGHPRDCPVKKLPRLSSG